MKISCQSCQAKYTIADEKVLGKIVKIRCKKCGSTIVINGNEGGAQAGGAASSGGGEGQPFDYAGAGGAEQWTVNVADGDQRSMTQEEILGAYRSGVVTDETYCWKDGMGDWLPIREIPELYGAVASGAQSPDQTAQEQSNAGAFPTPPPQPDVGAAAGYGAFAAPAAAAASTNGNGTANGLYGSTPAPAAAARRQGGRGGGGADLFGGVAQAGGEDDVMTSAPAGMPQASADPGKLTGQRNENSVLFSLNALTSNAPKEEAPPPQGEGSGLIDIRALSATMGSDTGAKKSGHVDDIMNLGGGGAFSAALAAPVLAPPTMDGGALDFSGGGQKKDNTKILLIGIIGAGGLIGLAIILAVLLRKPAEPVATPTGLPTDTATATATAPPPAPTASAAPVADNGGPAAAPPGTAGIPGDNADKGHGGGGGGGHHAHAGGGGGGGGGGGAPAAQADNTPPPAAAPPPAAGGGGSFMDAVKKAGGGGDSTAAPQAAAGSSAPFDRGAAAAALGSVNVAGCKKSDGPTGSGHIKVTFSPSGNVSSAVVDNPPFAGTSVGGCVAGKFRGAHIPAFAGSAVTVGKSFTID